MLEVRRLLRTLILVGMLVAFPAIGQQPQRIPRIVVIWNSLPQVDLDQRVTAHPGPKLIEDGLRDLGWVHGRNLDLVFKSAENRFERCPEIVEGLLRGPVDALVFFGNNCARAAFTRTKTVAIVIVEGHFEGLVDSLGRPGGNVTGTAASIGSPHIKRLEFLKAIAPKTSHVGFLWQQSPAPKEPALDQALMREVTQLGLKPILVPFASDSQLEKAFVQARRRGANAIILETWPTLGWGDTPLKVHRLAAEHRLPTVYPIPSLAQSGGLIAFGADYYAGYRRVPYYLDRILRGTRPGDLPVEQPAKFMLNINRRTAFELGLEIPQSLRVQADNVFE